MRPSKIYQVANSPYVAKGVVGRGPIQQAVVGLKM